MAEQLATAKQLLENGEIEAAVGKAREAYAVYNGMPTPDLEGMMQSTRTEVAANIALDKLEDAMIKADEVLGYCRQYNSPHGQCYMLLAKAELFCADKEPDKALALAPEIKGIIPSTGEAAKDIEKDLLNMQVNANLLKGAPSAAMGFAKELRGFASAHGDVEMEANAWHAIASVHHMQETETEDTSTPDDVVQAAESAMKLYAQIGNKKGEATAMNTMAKAQLRQEKVSQGLKTATDSLGIFREIGYTKGMVASLEIIVQAHDAQDNAMAGLQAANKELAMVKSAGNLRGEADILKMISQTHAMLGNPYSALTTAKEALNMYSALGDNVGQGEMWHATAEMKRSLGQPSEMEEATAAAEKSLKFFRLAGSKWGEEMALQTISGLMVLKGRPEKAPKRGEANKALKELQKAIEMRKPEDIAAAEKKINALGTLVGDDDIQGILVPVLQKDPSALDFLEEQGWNFKKEKGDSIKIKQYPHKGFYLHMVMTGMNFGPQFRVVNPYRVGSMGNDPTALSVSQLQETEAWQMEMGFRPGMLDSGLQCQAQLAFP